MKSEDRAAKFLAILDNKDWETNAHIRTMKADSLNLQRIYGCFRKLLVGSTQQPSKLIDSCPMVRYSYVKGRFSSTAFIFAAFCAVSAEILKIKKKD